MRARPPEVLSPAALVERLQPRRGLAGGSPAVDDPLWVVDLDADARVGGDDVERALCRLRDVSCPVVGLGAGDASTLARALARDVDVRAASRTELAAICETTARAPRAAAALAQLLRLGDGLDVFSALVAESFAYSTLQAGPEFAAWLEGRPSTARGPEAESPVRVSRQGDTLHVRLTRPERRNAYSSAMRDALFEALELADADPSLGVELRGEGPAFCSGGDLDEFGTLPDPATAHAVRTHRSPGRLLARIADRTVAHVHGTCVGAGVELPAFAGRVVAAPDATFRLPELRMGLVPGAGGTASLPRRIGPQRTAWLALTAEPIDAERALAWGVVDELAASPGRASPSS